MHGNTGGFSILQALGGTPGLTNTATTSNVGPNCPLGSNGSACAPMLPDGQWHLNGQLPPPCAKLAEQKFYSETRAQIEKRERDFCDELLGPGIDDFKKQKIDEDRSTVSSSIGNANEIPSSDWLRADADFLMGNEAAGMTSNKFDVNDACQFPDEDDHIVVGDDFAELLA